MDRKKLNLKEDILKTLHTSEFKNVYEENHLTILFQVYKYKDYNSRALPNLCTLLIKYSITVLSL